MKRLTFILLCIAVALQVFDGWSTLFLLQHGGIEVNPLAVWMFGVVGGEATIVLLKMLVAGAICFVAWAYDERKGVKVLGLINGYYLILLGAFNFRYVLRVI